MKVNGSFRCSCGSRAVDKWLQRVQLLASRWVTVEVLDCVARVVVAGRALQRRSDKRRPDSVVDAFRPPSAQRFVGRATLQFHVQTNRLLIDADTWESPERRAAETGHRTVCCRATSERRCSIGATRCALRLGEGAGWCLCAGDCLLPSGTRRLHWASLHLPPHAQRCCDARWV